MYNPFVCELELLYILMVLIGVRVRVKRTGKAGLLL